MTDCWHAEPEIRPSFTDLVNRIELMLNPPPKTPARTSTQQPEEGEQIYMNLSRQDSHDYLHPVDHNDGTTTFSPRPPPPGPVEDSGRVSLPQSPGDVAVGFSPNPQSPAYSPPS